MNRRQKIIVSVIGIFIVLLALIGLTYAYFVTKVTGNTNDKSITVTTANLKLVYGGDDGNVIGGNQLFPSNTEHTKTFTVYNEGDVDTDYGVYLIDVINTFERKDDIKYTLTCTTDGTLPCGAVTSETTFPSGIGELSTATIEPKKTHTYTFKFTYRDTGTDQSIDMGKELSAKIQIFGENNKGLIIPHEADSLAYNIINNASNATGTSTILSEPETTPASDISGVTNYKTTGEEGTFAGSMYVLMNVSKTWYYYDTYTVDATTGIFTLSGKHSCTYNSTTTNSDGETVNCYDDMKGKYLSQPVASYNTDANNHTSDTISIFTRAYKVTSATANTLNYVNIYNIPNDAERVLATTKDDYGTSYYYRGNIEDNYVNFAGMCWRIVRIDGNGNTKLILEDQDEVCGATMNGNWDIEASDGTTITMNGSEPYRTGNFGYDDSTGKYKMSYLNPVDNSDRAMVNAFKYFQTNTLTNKISLTYPEKTISDFLETGKWCLNNKAYKRTGTYPNYTYYPINAYDNTEGMFYDSYVRLEGKTPNEPTLKCPVETMETYADNTIPMYVGTLTADEIAYAGGAVGAINGYFYLINKWQRDSTTSFWSLSPSYFVSDKERVFYGSCGSLNEYLVNIDEYAFRPSVSLKSGTTLVDGGEGTLENPYVID